MAVTAAVCKEAHDAALERAPAGVDLRLLEPGDLDPKRLRGVSFLVPNWTMGLDVLRSLPDLRVVQVLSAGTDWIEHLVPEWATLCNARGTRDVPMAEWVLGALLGATSGLLRAARDRRWEYIQPAELQGQTVLVVGFGSIGRALRHRLEPLGARVLGVAAHAREGVHGPDDLPDLLLHADAVVVLAPLTPSTRGMIDAAFLARMRDGALFVNAGRGAVVDTAALLAELESGRLRAVLDVVEPEPLPAEHPLWRAKGTLGITAHQAGDSPHADERAAQLAAEQLRRFARGEPLQNVVTAGRP
jgi:phosphoglycerate dehydrogenase-like enzyme